MRKLLANDELYRHLKSYRSLCVFIIGVILICIAGLKKPGLDADSLTYVSEILATVDDISFLSKEPMFWGVVLFNQSFFDGYYTSFFFIFALLGVSIKLYAIKVISPNDLAYSVFVYVAIYYILHELTQIRVGVASGLFLLSLKYVVNRNFKGFFVLNSLGFIFHYSAILAFPVYFISANKINIRSYLILPFIAITIAIFNCAFDGYFFSLIKLILAFLPHELGFKISLYIDLMSNGVQSEIKLINPLYISVMFMYYVALLYINKVLLFSEYSILAVKLIGLMISSFYMLSFIPVAAYRVSEFYGISLIIFIPSLVMIFKQRFVVRLVLSVWLVFYFIFAQLLTLNLS